MSKNNLVLTSTDTISIDKALAHIRPVETTENDSKNSIFELDLHSQQGIINLAEIINYAVNRTFYDLKEFEHSEMDYLYLNNGEVYQNYLMRRVQYGIENIHDLMFNLFIALLRSHKLISGNKRFFYRFTVIFLRILGFKIDFGSSNEEIINKIYYFSLLVQNNTADQLNELLAQANKNTFAYAFFANAVGKISIKYSALSIEQKINEAEKEIRDWIKQNVYATNSQTLNKNGKKIDFDQYFLDLINDFTTEPMHKWEKQYWPNINVSEIMQTLRKI
ncbi:hypothetical protein [Mycoplasma simbae]|uniref:hypothetical protein n=1 Tax=Mycoplasma simbae TaxID=36744 RepID=UPI000496230C|nr:hypothetical protein [Mycoplasma simbae]